MIRWGIIGTGNIAKRFIASLQHSENGVLYAIASRNEETRKQYAHLKTYDKYEELLKDECVDAVYIGLPHKLHAEWSVKALNHKKAVLCEKPAVMTCGEMDAVINAAKENNCFYMEAMKTKFTPAFFELKKTIESGILGKVKHIDVNFCSDSAVKGKVSPHSYVFEEGQGGSWYDVSSYLIGFVQSFYEGLPIKIKAQSRMKNGIDYGTIAELEYSDGRKCTMETALDKAKERTAIITAEKGVIKVPVFNRCTDYEVIIDGKSTHYHYDLVIDDFFGQIEEAHQCILKGKLESSIHSLDEIKRETELLNRVKEAAVQLLQTD